MTPKQLLKAIFYPLTETSVLFALLGFWVLATLAGFAGMLGLWLAIVVVPAVIRYQLLLLEAQARGQEPRPPGAEFFNWVHDAWSLFPAVIAVAIAWAAYETYAAAGTGAMLLLLGVCGSLYPAAVAVLAITYSPLQSINPVALYRFISESGAVYLVAPVYLLLIACLIPMTRDVAPLLRSLLEMFFVFSLHSVIGAVIQSRGLIDDIWIPDAVEPTDEEILSDIERHRIDVLGHAYGFISRDNRKGGFDHIKGEIGSDPDPAGAWAWYFNRMLGWEDQNHALFFAQHYVRDALQHGEHVAAVKTIMRGRAVNERFKPFAEDIDAAIAAAERTGNTELAAVLKRS